MNNPKTRPLNQEELSHLSYLMSHVINHEAYVSSGAEVIEDEVSSLLRVRINTYRMKINFEIPGITNFSMVDKKQFYGKMLERLKQAPKDWLDTYELATWENLAESLS